MGWVRETDMTLPIRGGQENGTAASAAYLVHSIPAQTEHTLTLSDNRQSLLFSAPCTAASLATEDHAREAQARGKQRDRDR